MTTILLYGELADLFGPVWKLNVASVGEAIRAIENLKGGLYAYFDESGGRGVDFNVKVNEVDTDSPDELRATRKIDTIKISPVVRGSKDKWVSVVVGIVMVVVAMAMPYMSPQLAGFLTATKAGLSIQMMIGAMGMSLAIGGIAQMIAGTPKVGGQVDDGGTQSNLFNGPENTTTQGGPVPLVYGGPILVGSQVISAGIFTEDTTLASTEYPDGDGGTTAEVNGAFYNKTVPY